MPHRPRRAAPNRSTERRVAALRRSHLFVRTKQNVDCRVYAGRKRPSTARTHASLTRHARRQRRRRVSITRIGCGPFTSDPPRVNSPPAMDLGGACHRQAFNILRLAETGQSFNLAYIPRNGAKAFTLGQPSGNSISVQRIVEPGTFLVHVARDARYTADGSSSGARSVRPPFVAGRAATA